MKETNKSKQIILQVHRIKHLQSEDFVFCSFFASELVTSPFIHSSARSHGLIGGVRPPPVPLVFRRLVAGQSLLSVLYLSSGRILLSLLSLFSLFARCFSFTLRYNTTPMLTTTTARVSSSTDPPLYPPAVQVFNTTAAMIWPLKRWSVAARRS